MNPRDKVMQILGIQHVGKEAIGLWTPVGAVRDTNGRGHMRDVVPWMNAQTSTMRQDEKQSSVTKSTKQPEAQIKTIGRILAGSVMLILSGLDHSQPVLGLPLDRARLARFRVPH